MSDELDLLLRIKAEASGVKTGVDLAKKYLAELTPITNAERAAWEKIHRDELRDYERFNRDKTRIVGQSARAEAAVYEQHLGPGFFSRLAQRASSAFKSAFSLGGAGGIGSLIAGVAGGNLLTSAITGTLGALKDQVTGAIKTGFDFNRIKEQTLLGFEIKLHGRKEAEDFFEQINKFAERAPQELDQVLDSTQKLMSAFNAKQALAALSAITDAVAAQGKVGGVAKEQIDGIGLALQQMLFKGRVSGEEITQLAERQVKVYKYLGDEIAKTDQSFAALTDDERIAKVQELGQKGLLNAKAAVAAILRGIQAEYGGTAERIAKETLSGIESNTADRFSRLAGQATGTAFEEYKKKRQEFLDLLNSSSGDAVAKGINTTTGEVLKAMDAAVDALRTGNLKGLGISAITSAAEGVKQGAKSLYDEGTSAAGRLVDGIMDRLDMHSPSRVMIGLGIEAGHSFLFGVQAGIRGGDFSAEIEKLIAENARRTGLPPELIRAVIRQESRGKPLAHSGAGARGLMQLMPGTARDLGVTNAYDPAQNVRAGADYLAQLLNQFAGRLDLALAAYNSGPARVERLGRVPHITETQNYVNTIIADYQRQLQLSGASGGSIPRGVSPAEMLAGLQRRDAFEHGGTPVYVTNAAELAGLRARDLKEHGGEGDERAGLLARDISEHGEPLTAYIKIPIWKKGKIIGYEALDPNDARAIEFQGLSARDAAQFGSELPVTGGRSVQDIIGLVPGVSLPTAAPAARAALQGAKQEADALSAAFGNLPPLINAAATESKKAQKDFEQQARELSGLFSNTLEDLITRGPREAFRTIRNDFLSLLIQMGRDWFESRIFKALSGTGNSSSGSGGGILSAITGGLRRLFGGGSAAATTAPFNPGYFGGSGAAGLFGLADNAFGGASLGASSTGAASGGGLFAGLNAAALAPALPFLGLSLGAGLGHGSTSGSLLGGAGGLLLGGSAAAFLAPALFTSLLGGASVTGVGGAAIGGTFGLGPAAVGLLTNPFTIAAGIGLIVGGFILGHQKVRRESEHARDQAMRESLKGLNQLLTEVQNGAPVQPAHMAALQIRNTYTTAMQALPDGKTREIALKDVSRLDAIIDKIAATNTYGQFTPDGARIFNESRPQYQPPHLVLHPEPTAGAALSLPPVSFPAFSLPALPALPTFGGGAGASFAAQASQQPQAVQVDLHLTHTHTYQGQIDGAHLERMVTETIVKDKRVSGQITRTVKNIVDGVDWHQG